MDPLLSQVLRGGEEKNKTLEPSHALFFCSFSRKAESEREAEENRLKSDDLNLMKIFLCRNPTHPGSEPLDILLVWRCKIKELFFFFFGIKEAKADKGRQKTNRTFCAQTAQDNRQAARVRHRVPLAKGRACVSGRGRRGGECGMMTQIFPFCGADLLQ